VLVSAINQEVGEMRRTITEVEIGPFRAVWIAGNSYIEVYLNNGEYPVHVLNTSGDLGGDGWPKGGRTPYQYVRDELEAFIEEDGTEYIANC